MRSSFAKASVVTPALGSRLGGGVAARALASLALAVATLVALPAVARAVAYESAGSFSAVTGSGNLPTGVAVDQSNGDVLVSNLTSDDNGVGELKRFDSSRALIDGFGGATFSSVAVDPTDRDVYGLDADLFNGFAAPRILTFDSAGVAKGSPIAVVGGLPFLQIATDSAGNVYYASATENEVQKYSPAGAELATIAGSGANALSAPFDVAVDSDGNVYVADGMTPDGSDFTNARVQMFDSAGANPSVLASGHVRSVSVDPVSDRVFVGKGADPDFEVVAYDAGEEVAAFGAGDLPGPPFPPQIAIDSDSGDVYVTDFVDNAINVYELVPPPLASTGAATAVTHSAATLNGTVNPNGKSTACQFQYGTSDSYGQTAPCTPGPGFGVGDVSVAGILGGLEPDTTYHYRVRTLNAGGLTTGDDQTFTTAAAPPSTEPPGSGGGGGGGGGGAPSTPPAPKAPTVAKGSLSAISVGRVRSRAARLRLRCIGGPCEAGRLALKARFKTAKAKRAKRRTIARKSYPTLAAGERVLLEVVITRAARKALARTGRLRVKVTGDVAAVLTFEAPRKARRA